MSAKPKRKRRPVRPPDLHAILCRFRNALSFAIVAHSAIDASGSLTNEADVLKHGVHALDAIADELDYAEIQLSRYLDRVAKGVRP